MSLKYFSKQKDSNKKSHILFNSYGKFSIGKSIRQKEIGGEWSMIVFQLSVELPLQTRILE